MDQSRTETSPEGFPALPPTVPGVANHRRRQGRHGRQRQRRRWWFILVAVTITTALALAVFHGALGYVAHFTAVRYLVYAVWLVPMAELYFLLAGQAKYRWGFRAAPGKFRLLIVQVTTAGREQDRVNEIIADIHGYRLAIPYQFRWCGSASHRAEPNCGDEYPLADRVLTVPERFTSRAHKKARALCYSARVRQALGLDNADVKILYNDDDVLPTRGYIRDGVHSGLRHLRGDHRAEGILRRIPPIRPLPGLPRR